MKSATFTTALATLLTASMLRAEESPEFPAGIGEVYQRLSTAILKEDMPTFMKIFHFDFIYEGMDGAALDRGPWRRLWLDRFADRTYEKMAFAAEEIVEERDEQIVVRVRRVAVVETSAAAPRQLEETIYEDTWVKPGASWELVLRAESVVLSRGTLARAADVTVSPTIAGLTVSGKTTEFWKAVEKSGAPLVETLVGDPGHRLVTFLWRGSGRETSVRVRGGLSTTEPSKALARLGKTKLWYRSERLPVDARFAYEFHLETAVDVPASGDRGAVVLSVRSTSADPLNQQETDGRSLAELPAATTVPWITRVNGRASGRVKRQTLTSKLLGERRFVSVYTPPDYEELKSACAAAFIIDRGSYTSRRVTGTVLDNLLAEKKISPIVVFMVHSEGSLRETLEPSENFVRFLGEELAAWARQNYRIHREASRCVIGGNGPGGSLAAAAALRYCGVFGHVLSENGDFASCLAGSAQESHCVPRHLAGADRLPLRFFLSVGGLEDATVLDANRHLRDVLEARGYATTYRSVAANQNPTTWQDALARGLMNLLTR